jgi:hypothetical protein
MAKHTAAKTAATAAVKVDTPISIPAIDVRELEVAIVGDTGLIAHAWSQKAKQQMLDKQMKKAKTAKEAKDPDVDYRDSLYWLTQKPEVMSAQAIEEARFGFPAVAFKNAAVTAAGDVDGAKMTEMRRRFHVVGEMVEIEGKPIRREDMVRIGMGVADIRFRGMFPQWRATIRVSYNASAISAEQIVNLLNLAGFGVGVGEWRPERKGQFGRFHVATQADHVTD